jgi:hypothetical protein
VAGDCDIAETCTGVSQVCPADAFKPSTTICRPAASDCDVAEMCMGTSGVCPIDKTALCDDGDACTDDVCETVGCTYTALPTDEPAGVACSADNASSLLSAPPAPECIGRCANILDQKLRKIGELIMEAPTATNRDRCMRDLRSASRAAAALQRRVARLVRRGRLDPEERAQRLLKAVAELAEGSKRLVTTHFCSRR